VNGKETQSGSDLGSVSRSGVGGGTLPPLDEIACDGCGRSMMSTDGPGLIAVIKGPCPDCGGAFHLVHVAGVPPSPNAGAVRSD
jgi:hypothetical protein